jgi:hypothetical protein
MTDAEKGGFAAVDVVIRAETGGGAEMRCTGATRARGAAARGAIVVVGLRVAIDQSRTT